MLAYKRIDDLATALDLADGVDIVRAAIIRLS